MIRKILPYILIAVIVGGLAGLRLAGAQIEDVSNFTGIHIKSSQLGTATPQFMIWNQGSSNAIEVRSTAGTVVYSVDKSGNSTQSGSQTQSGAQSFTGGLSVAPNVVISAPTAVGTATPGLLVLNAGVSNPAEFRLNLTATPYLVINPTAGARVNNAIIGSAAGKKLVCVTQTITGTGAVSHGLSTPEAAVCSLASDPLGDNWCTYTNSSGVVTAKVWTGLLGTPAASSEGVDVTTCVIGTP